MFITGDVQKVTVKMRTVDAGLPAVGAEVWSGNQKRHAWSRAASYLKLERESYFNLKLRAIKSV